MNLNQYGTILTPWINNNNVAGMATFNFNGGVLRARAASGDFINNMDALNVQAGGAVIDTNGVDIAINQAMQHFVPPEGDVTDGGLRKQGTGGLCLTAANTYTGPTNVNAGSLVLTSGGRAGTSGTINVANNASLELWSNTTWTAGNIAFTLYDNVKLNGMGPAVDRPALNQDGGGGKITVAGTVTLAATSDIGLGGSSWNDMEISGQVTGDGGLVVRERTPARMLILSNTGNDYAGGTTVNSGTLVVTNPGALPGYDSLSVVTVNTGAVLAIPLGGTGTWDTTSLNVLQANVNFNTGSYLGLDTTGALAPIIYADPLSGGFNLAKVGAGTLSLTNATNSYTGATMVAGGVLSLDTLPDGGVPSVIGQSSADPANLVLNGGTLQYTGLTAATTNRGYTVVTGAIDVANELTMSGTIAAVDGGVFYKQGAGVLRYTNPGANTIASRYQDLAYVIQNGSVVFDGGADSVYSVGNRGELVVGDTNA